MLTEREDEIFQSLLERAPETFRGKLYPTACRVLTSTLRSACASCSSFANRISVAFRATLIYEEIRDARLCKSCDGRFASWVRSAAGRTAR